MFDFTRYSRYCCFWHICTFGDIVKQVFNARSCIDSVNTCVTIKLEKKIRIIQNNPLVIDVYICPYPVKFLGNGVVVSVICSFIFRATAFFFFRCGASEELKIVIVAVFDAKLSISFRTW